jgi:hypothetical protein
MPGYNERGRYYGPEEHSDVVDIEQLDAELASSEVDHDGVSMINGLLIIHGLEDPASVEGLLRDRMAASESLADAVVASHSTTGDLDAFRTIAIRDTYRELNRRLEDVVTVEYPAGSGHLWPVCQRGHRHWRAAKSAAEAERLAYPFAARTKDGLGEHSFTGPEDVAALADLIDAQVVAQQQEAEVTVREIAEAADEGAVEQALAEYLEG